MDTELTIKNLMLMLRGLEYYSNTLEADIKNIQDEQLKLEEESNEYAEMEITIARMVDEMEKANNVLRRAEEIYSYRYEQEHGEAPIAPRY